MEVFQIKLALPDHIAGLAKRFASDAGLDLQTFINGALADHLAACIGSQTHATVIQQSPRMDAQVQGTGTSAASISSGSNSMNLMLDIAHLFPGFPPRSIAYGQRFLDEIAKIPGVAVRKHKRGVAVSPNFAWIEYLLSQGGRSGIAVSLFGNAQHFPNHGSLLKPGRTPSYSRALIESDSALEEILKILPQSYGLKFGGNP